MIFSSIKGGLGNQLFQYALGRRIADGLGVDLVLENGYYASTQHYHPYLLPAFNIRSYEIPAEETIEKFSVYIEEMMAYDPEVLQVKDNVLISGYWQNYKYVEPIKGMLRKEITPKIPLEGVALEVEKHIKSSHKPVCLHVRGTDYKGWSKFDVVNQEFYRKAIAQLIEKLGMDITVYLFTDDVEYARHLLTGILPPVEVKVPQSGLASTDLYLMSLCKHFIIPNSTFSWWGAFLSDNPAKFIFAPRQWWNPAATDITVSESMRDLITPDMTLIDF